MDFANLIGNYAFPIAMCILMWSDNRKQREDHKAEVDKLADVINRNTDAITSLANKM